MKKIVFLALLFVVLTGAFAQTQWMVNNTASWQAALNGISSGGNNKTHTVTVSGTVSVPGTRQSLFGDATGITVTLQGSGTLALSSAGILLAIGGGKTVVVRDLTLQGIRDNDLPVVSIIGGGTFHMEGSASIKGNNGSSGGICVVGGTFTMEGGTISGNTTATARGSIDGCGVWVNNGGTFIMRGGTISGNTTGGSGGGVGVGESGTFTMEGGTISGNTATNWSADGDSMPGEGGGVHIRRGGPFTMRGGSISGNRVGREDWGYGNGGGVSVYGTFYMEGGTIGGNISNTNSVSGGAGGGVYVLYPGTFIKTGGTIYGSNETNAALRNSSHEGHAVYFRGYFRDTTLPANASGNISTPVALPTASGQTLNNWTRR